MRIGIASFYSFSKNVRLDRKNKKSPFKKTIDKGENYVVQYDCDIKSNKCFHREIYFLGRSVFFSHYNLDESIVNGFVSQQSEKDIFTDVVPFCGAAFFC